jgi:hypothetical protein
MQRLAANCVSLVEICSLMQTSMRLKVKGACGLYQTQQHSHAVSMVALCHSIVERRSVHFVLCGAITTISATSLSKTHTTNKHALKKHAQNVRVALCCRDM